MDKFDLHRLYIHRLYNYTRHEATDIATSINSEMKKVKKTLDFLVENGININPKDFENFKKKIISN